MSDTLLRKGVGLVLSLRVPFFLYLFPKFHGHLLVMSISFCLRFCSGACYLATIFDFLEGFHHVDPQMLVLVDLKMWKEL